MKNWHIKILLAAAMASCTAFSCEAPITEDVDSVCNISYIKSAKHKLELKQMFFRFAALAGAGLVIYNLVYTNNIENIVSSKGAIAGATIALGATVCDDILTTKFNDHYDRVIDYNKAKKNESLDYLNPNHYVHKPYKYPHTRLANWCLGLFGFGCTAESVRLARSRFSGNGTGDNKNMLQNQTVKYFDATDISDLLISQQDEI